MGEIDFDKISITEVVYVCFKHDIYVKTDLAGKDKLRIIADTPDGIIKGNELYYPQSKSDQKRMKEKIDDLYRYFYKKIITAQEKNQQSID